MSRPRQLVCPDCKRVFDGWQPLAQHANRHWFGHAKAKRNIRRHNRQTKAAARKQHPTIRQANKGRQRNPIGGWANSNPRPWNTPTPAGRRVAQQVRELENDRYWE